jgi:tetratricopeptide (TPR) repeat protein
VAIKMLPVSFSAHPEARQRLKREAQILAQIKHPNVAQVYDLDDHEQRDFIVMELVKGDTLRQRLEGGPLLEREAVGLVLQLLEGLAEAHANGVVHRDLKPENLMLTPEGALKILDFGIAKEVAQDAADPASAHTAAGTAPYMAPEQILGKRVDARTDLYAIGVILAELLTGERPYRVSEERSLVEEILTGQPVSVRDRNPGLSPGLDACVRRLLEKDPDARFQSASELARTLQSLWPVKAGETGSRAGVWRRTVVTILLGGVAIALLLRLFAPSPGPSPELDPNAIAVFPFSVRGDETLDYLGEGMVDLLHASFDGAGELRGINPARLLREMEGGPELLDPDQAGRIARNLHAGSYVSGSVIRLGSELRITATLYEVDGDEQQSANGVARSQGELPSIVDGIARDLLRGRVAETDLPRGIDTNLPALRAYLDGQQSLRAGLYPRAIEDFERAVAADSTFAYGWLGLSDAAAYLHDLPRELIASRHVLSLRTQVPERYATLLELSISYAHEASSDPVDRLREFTVRYPDETRAWFVLSDHSLHLGPLLGHRRSEGAHAMERALEAGLDGNDWGVLFHRRILAASQDDLESYGAILDRLDEVGPDSDYADLVRYEAASLDDDDVRRREILDRLATQDDQFLVNSFNSSTGGMAESMTDLVAARDLATILAAPERSVGSRALGLRFDACLDAAQGRRASALSKLREARALTPDYAVEYEAFTALVPFPPAFGEPLVGMRDVLMEWTPSPSGTDFTLDEAAATDPHRGLHQELRVYLLGVLSAQSGDEAAAELYASSLREIDESDLARSFARGIEAQVALTQQDVDRAIALLEPRPMRFNWILTHFSPFLARTRERFLLAEALREKGELQEALLWYDLASIQSTWDVVYRAPCHLRRGQVYEVLGEPEQALEHYRRFVDLWSDCDLPLRPLVTEARSAIARLES